MSSRKPSANKKRVQEFKSQLGDFDDVFARERRRSEKTVENREHAREAKACTSKNRYSSEREAEMVIAECAAHGQRGLKSYRCPYCDQWHLTSHPWD